MAKAHRVNKESNLEANAGVVLRRHSADNAADLIDENDAEESPDEMRALDSAAVQAAIEEMEIDDEDDSADFLRRMEQSSSFDKDEPDSLLNEVDPAPPGGD